MLTRIRFASTNLTNYGVFAKRLQYFRYTTSQKDLNIELYGYSPCPFSHKVCAFLDYKNLPYKVIEVNPMTKKEISFSKDYKKVPICIINGQQVNNSIDIIRHVQKEIGDTTPESKTIENLIFFVAELDKKYIQWVDERLARLYLVNLYPTFSKAYKAFGYIMSQSSWGLFNRWFVRLMGAIVMKLVNPKMQKRFGIEDPVKELEEELNAFCNDLGDKKFLNGDEISIGDVVVFGVTRAVEPFHVGNDIFEKNQKFKEWYERMKQNIGPSKTTAEQ